MAVCSSLSRKVYGALLVVMLLISVLESAKCQKAPSLTEDRISATNEDALPDAKNSHVQGAVIGNVKTVARRGSPGRTNGSSGWIITVPPLLTSAVLIVVVFMAAAVL